MHTSATRHGNLRLSASVVSCWSRFLVRAGLVVLLKGRNRTFNALLLCFAVLLPAVAGSADEPLYAWRCVTPQAAWSARIIVAMIVFDDKLWVLGGSGLNDVWCSPDGATWSQVTDNAAWSKRWDFSASVFGGKMWVMGGILSYTYNDVWCSPNGSDWMPATTSAAWTPRYAFASATFADKLWVLGGVDPPYDRDVWSSSDGVAWASVAQEAPWPSRDKASTAVLNGKLWLIGGQHWQNLVEQDLNDVWCTLDGVNWTQAVEHAPWAPRMAPSVAFDDRLWVLGGSCVVGTGHQIHYEYFSDAWRSSDGVNWASESRTPWSARAGHGTVSFHGGLWVAGGEDLDGNLRNDVWCMTPVTISINAVNGAWREEGAPLDLKLVTSGLSGPISYQWTKDGTAIADATTDAYHIDEVSPSDQASYNCQATDQYAAVFTAKAIEIQVFPEGSLPASGTVSVFLAGCACLTLGIVALFRRGAAREPASPC